MTMQTSDANPWVLGRRGATAHELHADFPAYARGQLFLRLQRSLQACLRLDQPRSEVAEGAVAIYSLCHR